jgi:hypothetical protein
METGTSAILTEIQARLLTLTCPSCGRGKLDLSLRCDLHQDGCSLVARCGFCDLQYLVDPDAPRGSDPGPRPEALTKVVCPRCGGPDCSLVFRCTAESRRCAYEILCRTCPGLRPPERSAV